MKWECTMERWETRISDATAMELRREGDRWICHIVVNPNTLWGTTRIGLDEARGYDSHEAQAWAEVVYRDRVASVTPKEAE